MPPSSASTLFRRSEGLTKLQLSLRYCMLLYGWFNYVVTSA